MYLHTRRRCAFLFRFRCCCCSFRCCHRRVVSMCTFEWIIHGAGFCFLSIKHREESRSLPPFRLYIDNVTSQRTMASSSLFRDQAKFAKRQADAANFLASTEKRHKNEKAATQKATRPKSTLGRSKTSSDFLTDQRPSTSSKSNFLLLATIVEKLQVNGTGSEHGANLNCFRRVS
jgi:hypothetical protein